MPEGQHPPFTPRMVDIALLLVDGATDREIARSLGVSERTVSADVRRDVHAGSVPAAAPTRSP